MATATMTVGRVLKSKQRKSHKLLYYLMVGNLILSSLILLKQFGVM